MTDEPRLLLGPVLRYADERSATVWVETDRRCEVAVLGSTTTTFTVAGHHYALVVIDDLPPGHSTPYEVHLDDRRAWPEPGDGWPAPVIRTVERDAAVTIAFGSCRVSAPDEEPWILPAEDDPRGFGPDALAAYARALLDQDRDRWPDLLLLLGDQVYADAASPETRAFARQRRDTSKPPFGDVADFEEYTHLYRESWSNPAVRWLLSTVPTAMIFDDHDVIDDWNISAGWLEDMREQPWWRDRITGALASYWCYQHLGNLRPDELDHDTLYAEVRAADDAGELLHQFAFAADRDPTVMRWSFARHVGAAHLIAVDSRAARMLTDGHRDMLDASEWDWLVDRLAEPTDHVLLASSLPVLLPPAIHDVERWNEAICSGAWGSLAARAGEGVRRAIDLEHWSAFGAAFDRLSGHLQAVASGEHGPGPQTLAILSGDVHNGYATRGSWPGVDLPLWQLVSSPLRQGLERSAVTAYRFARSAPGRWIGRVLRRLSREATPDGLTWQMTDGPVIGNHIATLDCQRGGSLFRVHRAEHQRQGRLETLVERPLGSGESLIDPA